MPQRLLCNECGLIHDEDMLNSDFLCQLCSKEAEGKPIYKGPLGHNWGAVRIKQLEESMRKAVKHISGSRLQDPMIRMAKTELKTALGESQ